MTLTPLSHRLRAETREAHTTAERSGIMRDLLRGTIAVPAYVSLLHNLAALYETLEAELDRNCTLPALSGVEWSSVRRFAALQNDIKQLTNGSPLAKNTALDDIAPSTREYVRHLRDLGAHHPTLLFPHAYLRYLGDMYGGQIIKRIVLEKVIPDVPGAVSFYEFDQIENLHAFMVTFREAMDSIPLTSNDADRMVSEAQLGYELHARIFEELASR